MNSLNSQSQLFLEEDKHWVFLKHQENDAGINILSGFIVNMQGDTLIDGKVYKKLYSHNLKGTHNCQFPPCFTPNFPYEIEYKILYALVREDPQNGIIYHYNQVGSTCMGEYELFNFQQIAGDTINECVREKFAFGDKDGLVDSISNVYAFNAQRKVIHTTGDGVFEGLPFSSELKITEGIGFDLYGFFAGTQDELVEVCFGSLNECNIISSINKVEPKSKLKIYPNPVYDRLNIDIEIKIKSASILDSYGNIIFMGDIENINIDFMQPGIYHLSLILESNEVIITKFVKIY